jgi:hypothetical protein
LRASSSLLGFAFARWPRSQAREKEQCRSALVDWDRDREGGRSALRALWGSGEARGPFIAERGLGWTRWAVAVTNLWTRADVRAVGADEGGLTSGRRESWSVLGLGLGLAGLGRSGPRVIDVVTTMAVSGTSRRDGAGVCALRRCRRRAEVVSIDQKRWLEPAQVQLQVWSKLSSVWFRRLTSMVTATKSIGRTRTQFGPLGADGRVQERGSVGWPEGQRWHTEERAGSMFEFEENVPARCLWTRPQEVSEIVFFRIF